MGKEINDAFRINQSASELVEVPLIDITYTYSDDKFPEKGIKKEEEGDGENTLADFLDLLNNPDNNVTITSGGSSESLSPGSIIRPVQADDYDDNPQNDPLLETSDGEIIITND